MSFSGAVKIADLNDFIAPSQACVINLDSLKTQPLPADIQLDEGVQVQSKPSKKGWSQTLPVKSEKDAVKISLQDCLACSGCVTSAETVLLEHQSIGEFQERIEDPSQTVIVSLSQQSMASLAVAHNLPINLLARKLIGFLRSLGVKAVFDIGATREISLQESADEFCQRYKRSRCKDSSQEDSVMNGATANGLNSNGQILGREKRRKTDLPMLASACPGWVCYAEKTHGDYALPYISTVKSPQAMMGSIIKGRWASSHGLKPESIYHCSIMPCYDKKLEASRDDFFVPGTKIPETDSVLTTGEVQQLLEERNIGISEFEESSFDSLESDNRKQLDLIGCDGVSGGYMDYIFKQAAKRIFDRELPDGPLKTHSLRNTDFQEICLEVDGRIVLRFASAYGFRNIQTLLRKIKQGMCQYDYVEIMACPSGCTNGGGQIKARSDESAQEVIRRVEGVYHDTNKVINDDPEARKEGILKQFGLPGISDWRHTQYHKRDKTVTSMIKDW